MKNFYLLTTLLVAVCSGAWANYSSSTVGSTTTLTWDFGEYSTKLILADENKTQTYEGLTLVGSGTANYTSDYVKASDGFHMNGASSSTTRYIKYRPTYAGTLTVNYRSNNSTATDRITAIGTAVSTFSSTTEDVPATVLACGYTNGSTTQSINANLSANTDYYIFFAKGGQNIPSLQYVYTAEASDEPTSTSVSPTSGTIVIGGTIQLTGSFTGGSFTGEWVSDDEDVATVSNTGLVTGVAAGTAHITYQWTEDQSEDAYKATATITVLEGFNSDGFNKVADLDFKAMPNTEFTVGTTIGNIYNSGNSSNQSILPITTEGFEYLAIQQAFDGSNNKGWKIVNGSGLYEGSGAERTMAIRNLKEDWVVEIYHTSGTNFYTKNDGSDDGVEKTLLVTESDHHVFRAEEAGMMGFNLTKGKYVTRIVVWTTDSPDATISYSNTGTDGGIAPAGMDLFGLFSKITLPAVNKTLSKSGYTQTGWTDGVNNYTMGQIITAPVTNTTFTPVFIGNTQSLDKSESETVITWNFRNSAISLNMQNKTGYYVKQATINGSTIDVPMYLNATSGKLNNQNRNDEWIQANNGTVLTIPAIKGMNIVMNAYDVFGKTGQVQTQINGNTSYALSNSNKTATYDYTGENSSVDIAIGSDIRYLSTITVTYPVAVSSPADPTTSGDETYLTTSDNMAGWRAFYDASNSYSVDGNTKVYVADVDPVGTTITLKSIEGIPADVPVILHTSSSADSHKMTLTKETVSPFSYTGTNNLIWTASAVSEKYRLGFGASGVGFYPYSGTPASGAVILNVSSAAARALTFSFDDEVTGVKAIETNSQDPTANCYYDLQGRKVVAPTKGLYIVNGKKVVVK